MKAQQGGKLHTCVTARAGPPPGTTFISLSTVLERQSKERDVLGYLNEKHMRTPSNMRMLVKHVEPAYNTMMTPGREPQMLTDTVVRTLQKLH